MMGKIRAIAYYTLLIALGFAIASKVTAYYGGGFNIPHVLLLDAIIWFALTVCGIIFLIKKTKEDLLSVAIAFPIFVVTIFGIMLSDEIAEVSHKLFGADKTEVIKILGLGISGVIAVYGFAVFNRRAAAQDKANELTKQGHVQDQFKAAVEHLSSTEPSARIASFYEFFYLAKNEHTYAENIFRILCAHLRHISNDEKSKQGITEQQTLIDILFSSKAKEIFEKFDYDLRRVKLLGIDFQEIHKPEGKVNFSDADLSEAVFGNMDLSGFIFQKATLHKTEFFQTNLQKTNLSGATLSEATLSGVDFSDKTLSNVNFSGAKFFNVDFSGTKFLETTLSDAKFPNADLSGVDLHSIDLSGADLSGAIFSDTDLSEADLSGADLRGADLSNAKNLQTAKLLEAKYSENTDGENTKFPDRFFPEDHEMELCSPDKDDNKKQTLAEMAYQPY